MVPPDRWRIIVWSSDWTETIRQTILTCQMFEHQARIEWVYTSYGRDGLRSVLGLGVGGNRSWIGHAGRVMQCEKLRANTAAQFRPLVDYIGIDASGEDTSCALEASTLNCTLSARARSSTVLREKLFGGFSFARKDRVGERGRQFATELDDRLER